MFFVILTTRNHSSQKKSFDEQADLRKTQTGLLTTALNTLRNNA